MKKIKLAKVLAAIFQLASSSAFAATLAVVNTNDAGPGSLRQAILDSNASVGVKDTIGFLLLPSAGVQTIQLASALPSLKDPVVIDGTTESGYSGAPLVMLDGSAAGAAVSGLDIKTTDSVVKGLIVSGFSSVGVNVLGNNNTIQGCWIGLDSDGLTGKGNGNRGMYVKSDGNLIGGAGAHEGNVISGNGSGQLDMGGSNNTVFGNSIGVDATSSVTIPNSSYQGISIQGDDNVIGGTNAGEGNVVAGNDDAGILIGSCKNNLIQGNAIGTNFAGLEDWGNGFVGIYLYAAEGNEISANRIAFNGTAAVLVDDTVLPFSVENLIQGNSIYGNDFGIDLGSSGIGNDGVTVNDALDADGGANGLQNYPVLKSALADSGGLTVKGSLNSAPAETFRIEFFSSPVCDASGYGQGANYLGFVDATTDNNGDVSFEASAPGTSELSITATATDSLGNTSEFSKCLASEDAPSEGTAGGTTGEGTTAGETTTGGATTGSGEETTGGFGTSANGSAAGGCSLMRKSS